MATYVVKTNIVGGPGSNFKGLVAYREEEVHYALAAGLDLECFAASAEPKRMIIPWAEIRARVDHPRHFPAGGKYKEPYTLLYYFWHPTHENGVKLPSIIEQWELERKQREPSPDQRALF